MWHFAPHIVNNMYIGFNCCYALNDMVLLELFASLSELV